MISWRYHVVSIVGVVLAFGLGILAGSSVVGDELVAQLRQNTEQARDERDEALATVERFARFTEGLQPTLRDGALVGEEVVVVTMDGADAPAQQTVEELTAAGVEVLATLELDRRLTDVEAPENVDAMEDALGLVGSDPDSLPGRIADALAVRLAVGPDEGEEDLLGSLMAAGLVTADRDLDEEALLEIGGAGQLMVVAAGGRAPRDVGDPEILLVPITERLVQLGSATSGVGPTDDAYGFVRSVRAAPEILDCAMVTVDDIDLEVIGGITLTMAIDRYLEDPDPEFRPGGDYGLEGDTVLPGADPPESCRR
ncbi:MAG TPA: copper transporter [Actinomycetota bacterium]|nr:copper transporter [Actinomycetota bacterium]